MKASLEVPQIPASCFPAHHHAIGIGKGILLRREDVGDFGLSAAKVSKVKAVTENRIGCVRQVGCNQDVTDSDT